jgi:hypothetical protein
LQHLRFRVTAFVCLAAWLVCLPAAWGAGSCMALLAPGGWSTGAGPDGCEFVEARFRHGGRDYLRLDAGLSGTAKGFTVNDGQRAAYFTTAPDFVFVQTGSSGDWQPATVRYEAAKGTGFALLIPARREDWNGKLWLSVHGAGRSFEKGSLRPWDERVPEDDRLRDISLYERWMLERGFAVVKSFRSSDKKRGDCVATLANGEMRAGMNITETPHIQLDFLVVAQRMVKERLGSLPRRNYFYGHSAGGRNGRVLNYQPGLNRRADGKPFFDGFLIDDAGSGIWLPVLLRGGKDVLFADAESRAAFVPQIDVTHQQYLAFTDEPAPDWVSGSYLLNKWRNAKMLRDKGLGAKHRMYEVRGVSHSGGEYGSARPKEGVEVLPLWRVMDSIVDLLDAWVEQGQQPPPTRSDWKELAEGGKDGGLRNEAIAMPEVACPLGVYHPYPAVLGEDGVGTTGFAAFDGQSEEPLDGRGMFVDMNRNGYHDYRESVTEAWQRLGLLREGERFTREAYGNCVSRAARALAQEGLLHSRVAKLYGEEAQTKELPLER